ncbi:MAG: two-component system histidine kinase PnpS [Candidatus Acidiferrales bacterium]
MRLKLFWKLGLSYLLLLFLVLLVVDLFAAATLRGDYLRAGFEQLEALSRLAQTRPIPLENPDELRAWTAWLGESGVRVTVVAADGLVLADSAHDPATMENHANRPEIQQALARQQGRAVRYSDTLQRDLLYLAQRYETAPGSPVVIRLALPLAAIDDALADFRRRLWTASLVLLILAGALSLLFSRAFSGRVQQLKDFSARVAGGDFRPLPVEREGDELAELAAALNQTAARLEETIRSLRDEHNRSAAILRSMVEGVAVISAEGHIVFCNQAFCRVTALENERCEGRPLSEVIRQSDLLTAVQAVLTEGQTLHREIEIGTLNPRSFSATAAPVEANGATGAVLVLHDVTQLQRLERVRRDFVANVTHEFKTPLTAIQGFAETLLGGALEDAAHNRRFLEIIREHASRLARLTDDLLKLSQIEAGKLELDVQPVPVPEIIEPCVEITRLKASQKQLTLVVESPAELPPVRGEASRLREVLQNLLDNAVQYTPSGGRITVRAVLEGKQVVISVADTGIGIPQFEQQRIFERFYRVDAARSREVGGTGLGLSIAKHFVEAHGGRLIVESEVGRGSTFTVFLPTI